MVAMFIEIEIWMSNPIDACAVVVAWSRGAGWEWNFTVLATVHDIAEAFVAIQVSEMQIGISATSRIDASAIMKTWCRVAGRRAVQRNFTVPANIVW